jgi:hypothetical protein
MKKRYTQGGRISSQGKGLGTVTEQMVLKRASEIARINGRSAKNVLDSDWEQARRELTQETIPPPRTAAELVPEDKRWDPIPETEGTKVPVIPPSDEQTVAERFVDEGVEDAEHDQMKRATKIDPSNEP